MKTNMFFLLGAMMLPMLCVCQEENHFTQEENHFTDETDEYLPEWRKGYLDIHQISTGRGNAAYFIFPDGTTMLLDAGDTGGNPYTWEIMEAVPNDSKLPGEWIAQYIKHFSLPLKNDGAIDYAMLTHFDGDHIGQQGKEKTIEVKGLDYRLSGITQVGTLLDISKLIDRSYPTYDDGLSNYRSYVSARGKAGKKNEKFETGSNTQIKLLKDPGSYPTFEVRNMVGNGKVWTGSGTAVKEFWPATTKMGENPNSCGIRITYGNFDYYSGGDLEGFGGHDLETPLSEKMGETDVVVADHHGHNGVNETFVSRVKAQAYVIPVWDFYHPNPEPLHNMLHTPYTGERSVFAAGLMESNRQRLGEDGSKIKPAGHIVIRVYPGGKKFQIFVLNDRSESYEILYKTDKMKSNK